MPITIEDMAKAGCTSARGIRYWEDQGLLGEVDRDKRDRRRYTEDHLRRARIIAAAQFGGFSLDEAKAMLAEWDGEAYNAVLYRLTQQSAIAADLVMALPEPANSDKVYDL